ncbi:LamG-like jellyroll fold domain-containing protein [Nocardia thraciensis]
MTAPLPALPVAAVDRMAANLTTPFAAGADRLTLRFATPNTFAAYDFREHIARFGTDPDPRYLLRARTDVTADTVVTIGYEVLVPGAPPRSGATAVRVLAGTPACTSLLVPLGADDGIRTRLRTVAVSGGGDYRDWEVTALLGNLAKLLWVVGAERDALAGHARRVHIGTRLPVAGGYTLDLIGSDLGVPRFPPLPYAFEADTVALYHFGDPTRIVDAQARYGGAGHDGTGSGVTLGVPGRFGTGCALPIPAARVTVPDHPDFAVEPVTDVTVELFVRPADPGTVVSKRDSRGWSIDYGDFGRGFGRDVSAILTDGVATVTLFADVNLETARFHHVALVLDRTAGQARLLLDGAVRAVAGAPPGVLTSAAPLTVGGFTGAVDELRYSRAARTGFHPVLGESDAGYRKRLTIFQRWILPTPGALSEAVNAVAGPVQGVEKPLVVDDVTSTLAAGRHPVRVLPATIRPDGSIDDLGRRRSTEAQVCGTVADDDRFDPALLADGGDARADFAAGATRMRVGTRRSLRALLDLAPARLRVDAGYDPAAADLRAVGRTLLLSHPTVPPDQLAVLAHRAGFSWVRNRADRRAVQVSVRSLETIEIVCDSTELVESQTISVRVDPAPPPGARCRWTIVHTGAGRAELITTPDSPQARLTARHTGTVTVEAQVNKGARAFSATTTLRIGLDALASGDSIAADGRRGVGESVAGTPDDGFADPAYLVDIAGHRLQPATAALFTALATAATGTPALTAAWNPAGAGLETVGRAATVEPGTSPVTVGRLAALAHAVGFDYVRNTGTAVRVAARSGDPVVITGPDTATEGAAIPLSVLPRALPAAAVLSGTTVCVANSGTGTVSVLAADGTVTRVLKTGFGPVSIAADPASATVYTADRAGTVTALPSGRTAAIPGQPAAVAHHPTAPRLYVAAQGTNRLTVLNDSTLAVQATVATGSKPVALAVQPGGAAVWVACAGAPVVQVLDTATNTVAASITLPGPAGGIAVSASRAYVTVTAPPQLVVIDTGTRTVVVPPDPAKLADVGAAPGPIAVIPDGTRVFVADRAEGTIRPRLPDGTAAADPVRTGRTPVALLADAARLYIVDQAVDGGGDNIAVLDLAHPRALATVWPLGTGHGERLTWTVHTVGDAAGQVSSTTAPDVDLIARSPGPLLVEAGYVWRDHNQPYTAAIRLSPALTEPVVLRKDQYDLVMNVLHELHPIGVEIDTRVLRAHVLELRGAGLQDVDPAYTYPPFRPGGTRFPAGNLRRPS